MSRDPIVDIAHVWERADCKPSYAATPCCTDAVSVAHSRILVSSTYLLRTTRIFFHFITG